MMSSNLALASVATLGILASFVFFVFYLIAFQAHFIDFGLLVGLTIATNILLWLVSPAITDFLQKWFYRLRRVSFEEFSREHPEVAEFIKGVCQKNNVPVPALRIIIDNNPTAYCYGSFPANARLVVSEGLFKYLNVEEQKAVYAHELGHIVNLDFIVMTVATTLLQILYEVYYHFTRRRGRSSGRNDPRPLIGIIAYVLYLIGTYLVLYLSRTREYLADRFSARETQNPDSLSMALVKIAYGIATETDNESTHRLLAATRQMGIYDYKSAHAVGATFKLATEQGGGKANIDELSKVFLFDIYNPWAKISELNSTHPLTGKRIMALSEFSLQTSGASSVFDFGKLAYEGQGLDRNKLYSDFWFGVLIYFLPFLSGVGVLALVLSNPVEVLNYPLGLALLGLAFLCQGIYKFSVPSGEPEHITVFKLMQDPYANPMRGRYVQIEGKVIGKADAGSYFGEDLTMQDSSGCLIYLNYESLIPILGNLFFGLGQAKNMIGQNSRAVGWFRRSTFQVIDLDKVDVLGKTIRSYTRFWGIILGVVFMLAAAVMVLMNISKF
jgi:Zn-dependent protease with chaperone function